MATEAPSNEAVLAAIDSSDPVSEIKSLQSRGWDVNSNLGYNVNALFQSVSTSYPLFKYLLSQGADPNTTGFRGTVLSHAARTPTAPTLMLVDLLAAGASQNTPGEEALHAAAGEGGSIEKVRVLLDASWDPNALVVPDPAFPGRAGKGVARGSGRDRGEMPAERAMPLHFAAASRWEEKDWHAEAGWPRWNPEEQVAIIELLLKKGADPGKKDAEGLTPVDWARKKGCKEAEAALEARG